VEFVHASYFQDGQTTEALVVGCSILYFKSLYNSPETGLKYISDMRNLLVNTLSKGIKSYFEETCI